MLFFIEKICRHEEYSESASLRAALIDCMYFSIMVGFGDAFLSTYGIALGGSSLQIGLLSTLPPLVGALSQLLGLKIFRSGVPRRQMIVTGSFIHGYGWIAASMLALSALTDPWVVWLVMAIACWQQISGSIIGPAWNSLIGDLVPPKKRGSYFGFRNQRSGWITVVFMLLGGWTLQVFRSIGHELIGFASLFFIAGLARIACAQWLAHYGEPGYSIDKKDQFSFLDFLKRAPKSNFAKFVFFYALMNGAASMAGPYVALYLLRDLHFSYTQFSIVSAAQLVTQYMFMQNWGKLLDEFGSKRILSICGTAVSFTTLLLLVSSNYWYIILAQIYSGLFWAGFNLASFNFMFDAVSPQKRAQCAAYMSLINAFFVCIGAYAGGVLITHLPADAILAQGIFTIHSVYFKVFLISCVLRALIVIFMLPRFREVKEVVHIHTRELMFRITNVRPISGATFSFIAESIRSVRR